MIALTYILTGIGTIILIVPAAILRGWALSVLWGWFVVPMGIAPLGIAHAIGFSLVVGLLAQQCVPSKDKDVLQPILNMLLTPFLAVGIGWIVKGYL